VNISKFASQSKPIFPFFKAVLLASLLVTACGKEYTDAEYLQRAKAHYEKEEFEAAIIEAKNSLQKNRINYETRLLLGKIYFDVGDYPSAESEIRKIPDSEVVPDEVVPLLARILQATGRVQDVLALPEEGLSDKALADLLTSKALAHMLANDMNKAAVKIDDAIARDPTANYTLIARAQLLTMYEEFEAARAQISAVLEKDPQYSAAYSLLGHIEYTQGNLDEAISAYSKAVQYSSNYYADLLKLAKIKIAGKKYDEALVDIQKLKAALPNNPGINYALGLIEFHRKNYQASINAFVKADTGDNSLNQFYQAGAHFHLGNLEQAATLANSFYRRNPDYVPGKKLLAEIYLKNKQFLAAEQLIRPVVESDQNDIISMNILAESLWQQDKMDESVDLLEKISTQNPDSTNDQLRLALGHIGNGDRQTAIDLLEKVLQTDPTNEKAYSILAMQYLKTNELDKAITVAENFRSLRPDSAGPYILLGLIYSADGDYDKSQDYFEKANKINPGNVVAASVLIDSAVLNKEFRKARKLCNQVLDQDEYNLGILLKLAAIEMLDENEEKMVAILEKAIEAHPTALRPRINLARHYLSHSSSEKVKNVLDRRNETVDKSPDALELLGAAQLDERDFKSAIETLKNSVDLRPDSADALFMLSRAYAGINDIKATEKALQKVVELDPNHLQANIALARLYFSKNEYDLFLKRLAILKSESPDNLDTLLLEASWENNQGNRDSALAILENIHKKSPTSKSVLALTEQKVSLGDSQGAQKNLEEWLNDHPDDLAARNVLASIYNSKNLANKANQQYLAILEIDANNPVALNNLAWNLRKSDPVKAMEYIETANTKSPNSTHIMDTYALVLAENGKIKKARNVIQRVTSQQPSDPTLLFHKALIEHKADDNASALRTIRTALDLGVDFADRKEAEALLNTLSGN